MFNLTNSHSHHTNKHLKKTEIIEEKKSIGHWTVDKELLGDFNQNAHNKPTNKQTN